MKRLFVLAVLLLGILSFHGCGSGGGGDSSLPVPSSGSTGGGNPDGGNPSTPPANQPGPAAKITLSSALPAGEMLPQGSTTTVSATVLDANNNPVADGTLVDFVANGGAVTSSSPTVSGVATATFQAGSRSGPVTITASCDTVVSQVSIQIETGAAASILVEGVQPKTIGVFGSGIEDAALITFLVRDAAGNPVPDGTKVNFAIGTGVNGGEKLTATSGTTAGGKTTVSLQSGTVAGTVSIVGTIDSLTISTVAQVTIANNRPDADRLTMGAEILNLAGGRWRGLQSPVHAYLGDRSGNVVPDGTPVSFISECGTIGTSEGFTATTEFGVATAILQTSSPTVPDLGGLAYGNPSRIGNVGLCRVVAFTPGKGAFIDKNGNGIFDAGTDTCTTSLDEPYIDANDSGAWEPGEYYVDVNKNDKFDSNVVNCQSDAMIWASMNLLNSDWVEPIDLYPPTFEIPVGGSQPFKFNVSDREGNALVAGTKVTVTTTAGTLAGTTEYVQPDTTGLGLKFTFALLSEKEAEAKPKSATVKVTITPPSGTENNNGAEIFSVAMGTINLSSDDPGLGPAPAPSSGDPATILFDVNNPQIFVAGVGRSEMSTLMLQVVDSAGEPINEAAYNDSALNNIRVSFITSPNGGEYLSGEAVDADGNKVVVDSRASGSITIRSDKGLAPINLQAGTLPGAVEIMAEMVDADGTPLALPIKASLPQIAISSGPPHTINLTYARASAENIGAGVYRRRATAMVTDRYGNTVPDGTTIYLGLLDSVIAQGTATSVSSSTVTAAAGTFDVSIKRNETDRKIQAKDRVILREVPSQDKSRHVSAAAGDTLTVQTPYSAAYGAKPFLVGASLLGGSVGGTLLNGASVTGTTQTVGGLADVYVTYPANIGTIGVGCGDIPNRDLRYDPLGSAKVFLVAESSSAQGDSSLPAGSQFDDRATTIDEGTYCFSPIAGFGLSILPSVKLTGTELRGLQLEDGGDRVPLPFYPLSSYVAIDTRGKANVCKDPALTTEAACDGAGKTWFFARGICFDENITKEEACTADGGAWVETTSDFSVDVYINPFTDQNGVDLDGDTFNDIPWVRSGDVDGNGIPDDLNRDGTIDLFDGNAIGWDFEASVRRYMPWDTDGDDEYAFFTYPYTNKQGGATALIVVRGALILTGDKATVTFVSGDGEASISVEMP